MFSRAQTFAVIAAVAALAAVSLSGAAGARPDRPTRSERPQGAVTARVAGLRNSIAGHRSATWRLQDRVDARHTPSSHMERRTRSVAFLGWLNRFWIHKQHRAYLASRAAVGSVPHVICATFHGQTVHVGSGGYVAASCAEALHIAWGESRDTTTAENAYGYAGLFQLGVGERATYGLHRRVRDRLVLLYRTAYEQTRAAFNLFRARGWEPWTCCGE